jgi:hypothetical protein
MGLASFGLGISIFGDFLLTCGIVLLDAILGLEILGLARSRLQVRGRAHGCMGGRLCACIDRAFAAEPGAAYDHTNGQLADRS